MQPDFNAAPQAAKQWPDFYSILNSTPETDADTLRKTINKMYVQANTELDHRELSRRFYYQVLSQKVLPQCRRVLLDKEVRTAYDEQWMLHRDGVEGALSYAEFITGLSKKLNVDSSTLLTESELAVLPSFENGSSVSAPPAVLNAPQPAVSASVVAAAGAVEGMAAPQPFTAPVAPAPTSESVAPAPAAKKSNLPLFGGLALLGLALAAGGTVWNSSRESDAEMAAPIARPRRATTRVQAAPQTPVAQAVTTETALRAPIVLNFDMMPGKTEGDVKIGPGLDGQGLILNGSGSVELPQTLDTSKSYTVMTWVKLAPTPLMLKNMTPFETFISADGPQQSAFFLQVRADSQRYAFAALPLKGSPTATFAGATSGYKVDTWYHIAGVHDAAKHQMSLYINGTRENTVTYTEAYRGEGTLRLGRAKFEGKPVDFVTGTLDDVRISQKAMSGQEILSIIKPLKAKAGLK